MGEHVGERVCVCIVGHVCEHLCELVSSWACEYV